MLHRHDITRAAKQLKYSSSSSSERESLGFFEGRTIHFSLAAAGHLYENGKCHGCVSNKKKTLKNVKRRDAGTSSYDK